MRIMGLFKFGDVKLTRIKGNCKSKEKSSLVFWYISA